jgi:hypothetical protein
VSSSGKRHWRPRAGRIIVVNPDEVVIPDEVEEDLVRGMVEVAGVVVCSPVWSRVCSSPR